MIRQPSRADSATLSRMIGSVYLEHEQPVTVLARWGTGPKVGPTAEQLWHRPPRSAPRNVLIERSDRTLVVRPFRGLRKSA